GIAGAEAVQFNNPLTLTHRIGEGFAVPIETVGQVHQEVADGLVVIRSAEDCSKVGTGDNRMAAIAGALLVSAGAHGNSLGIGADARLDHGSAFTAWGKAHA